MMSKQISLILMLVSFFQVFSQNEATLREIKTNNNIFYKNNVKFTGTLYSDTKANNKCSCTYEATIKDGLLHGTKTEYHNNGRLKSIEQYDFGKKSGLFQYWNENEILLKTESYVNNQLTDEKVLVKAPVSEIKDWKEKAGKYERVKNFEKAFEFYKLAALNGDVDSQFTTGDYFENGKGVQKSYEIAFKWYKEASSRNNIKAQKALALLYMQGNGVQKDKVLAEELLLKVANSGDVETQYILGKLYSLNNDMGLYFDQTKAQSWFEKAAIANNFNAQEELGAIYFQKEDFDNAAKWYLLAANNNVPRAQYVMGYLYKNGKGVEKNRKLAKDMWKKSCKSGYSDSCKEIEKMNAFGNSILNSVNQNLKK